MESHTLRFFPHISALSELSQTINSSLMFLLVTLEDMNCMDDCGLSTPFLVFCSFFTQPDSKFNAGLFCNALTCLMSSLPAEVNFKQSSADLCTVGIVTFSPERVILPRRVLSAIKRFCPSRLAAKLYSADSPLRLPLATTAFNPASLILSRKSALFINICRPLG